jgi:hypothetical protein
VADLAYTISVGSHMLGTVETRDVTAEDLREATIEIATRQWGRPVVLSVYDDPEASVDDEADEVFAAALAEVRPRR